MTYVMMIHTVFMATKFCMVHYVGRHGCIARIISVTHVGGCA